MLGAAFANVSLMFSSRRGRDFGTVLLALTITLLSPASGLVPLVAKRLTDGHSPVLADVVRILPSGWDLPFADLLFTVIAAACFTNFYGDDGTSLWLRPGPGPGCWPASRPWSSARLGCSRPGAPFIELGGVASSRVNDGRRSAPFSG